MSDQQEAARLIRVDLKIGATHGLQRKAPTDRLKGPTVRSAPAELPRDTKKHDTSTVKMTETSLAD